MIQHYFKIAFRNILKYKAQSIISILGLAVGFTCFALATLWIHYEMTYDDFHEGADRIYFVGRKNLVENENTIFASSRLPYAVHKQLKLDFPDAYRLLSATCDIQISQVVNDLKTVRVRCPKFDTGIPTL